MSKSRGGAEMDVYALGLCLYEALTGKTAYPRLPRGSAAYALFFRRAQTLEKPRFDSPAVVNDSRLLKLLVQMTAPDVSHRINSVAEVEIRLKELAGIASFDGEADTMGATAVSFTGISPSRTATVEVTSVRGAGRRARRRSPRGRMRLPSLVFLVCASCIAAVAAVHFLRPDISSVVERNAGVLLCAGKERICRILTNGLGRTGDGVKVRSIGTSTPETTVRQVVSDVPAVANATPETEHVPSTPENADTGKVSLQELPEEHAKKVSTPEGVRIMRESLALCSMLDPVEFRRNRIEDAERMLTRGVSSGDITSADAGMVAKKINDAKSRIVFRVINKSDRDLHVGEKLLKHGGEQIFWFSGSVPTGMRISCAGFVPMKIGNDVDGSTIRITPDCLLMEKVPVTIPAFPKDVSCVIDDAVVAPGVVKLMPGAHECTYTRPGYSPQSLPFFVEMAKPMELSPPMQWSEAR